MIAARPALAHEQREQTLVLVSCKHYGRAVGIGDEENIVDRLYEHDCDAFLGVYSSHPSQALTHRFDRLRAPFRRRPAMEIDYFTGEEIKRRLLETADGERLIRQYLPLSHLGYLRATTESFVFERRPVIECHECKVDLLQKFEGTIVYKMTYDTIGAPNGHRLQDIIACCTAHQPRGLPAASIIRPIEQLIQPATFIQLIHQDMNFQALRPPFFSGIEVHRKWVHLVHSLFYFVARGRSQPVQPDGELLLKQPRVKYGL